MIKGKRFMNKIAVKNIEINVTGSKMMILLV